jgi:hypothetical protein
MTNYQWYFFKFIKLAKNGNNEMQISESLPYQISTVALKLFRGYMEKRFCGLG